MHYNCPSMVSFEYAALVQLLKSRLHKAIIQPLRHLHEHGDYSPTEHEWTQVVESTKALLRASVTVRLKIHAASGKFRHIIWYDVLLGDEQSVMKAMDECREKADGARLQSYLIPQWLLNEQTGKHEEVKARVREMLVR